MATNPIAANDGIRGMPDMVLVDLDAIKTAAWLSHDGGDAVWTNTNSARPGSGIDLRIPLVSSDRTPMTLSLMTEKDEGSDGISDMMMAETEHRARNLLSIAVAMGEQCLGGALLQSEVRSFMDRLRGLSEVARVGCGMEKDRCEVGALVRQCTDRFDDGGDRIATRGPILEISSRWAHLLAIVLHELGANALRHGALRAGNGRVDVTWTVDEDPARSTRTLGLEWCESGGPHIAAGHVPGYGSRILTRMTNRNEGCTAVMLLPRDGLRYRLEIVMEQEKDDAS